MHLNVFDIQRSSYHDGPGLRTVVFLKGCNQHCFWCQNPESQNASAELMFFQKLCIGCGLCVKTCLHAVHEICNGAHVVYRERCVECGRCCEMCCTGALKLTGKQMSIEQIFQEIMRDKEIFQLSGGGVTISGGEPLLQHRGLKMLLRCLKVEGIHTAIETAANVPWETLETVLEYLDLVYIDFKIADIQKYRKFVGSGYETVCDNLMRLHTTGKNVIVRTPVIPTVNDEEQDIEDIARIVYTAGLRRLELLPFHKLGCSKYHALGKEYLAERLNSPSEEKMRMLRNVVLRQGLDTNME